MEAWLIGVLGAALGLAVGAFAAAVWRRGHPVGSAPEGEGRSTGVSHGLAHEIRNPLNTISITLQLLEEDLASNEPPGRDELRREVERVRAEVGRLEGILTDFQRYARLLQAEPEDVDVAQVVAEVLDFVEPEAARSQVEIHREVSAVPVVRADPGLLRQAFLNLIINAFQAMTEGGTLTVSTHAEADGVRAAFRDSGPGMDEATRGQVFDAFYSTKKSGTGLGLAVVDKVAQLHGGEVRLDSKPGEGATFTLHLPQGGGSARPE